jgi:hypothetical protein
VEEKYDLSAGEEGFGEEGDAVDDGAETSEDDSLLDNDQEETF